MATRCQISMLAARDTSGYGYLRPGLGLSGWEQMVLVKMWCSGVCTMDFTFLLCNPNSSVVHRLVTRSRGCFKPCVCDGAHSIYSKVLSRISSWLREASHSRVWDRKGKGKCGQDGEGSWKLQEVFPSPALGRGLGEVMLDQVVPYSQIQSAYLTSINQTPSNCWFTP